LNGNPLDDIHVIENPEKNLAVVMKDGKLHKKIL
jgi:hypothetical protein